MSMLRVWRERSTLPISVDVCQPPPSGHFDVEFIRQMRLMILEDRNGSLMESPREGYRIDGGDLGRTLIRKRGADELDGTAEAKLRLGNGKRQRWDDGGLLEVLLTDADDVRTGVAMKTSADVDVSDLVAELLDVG